MTTTFDPSFAAQVDAAALAALQGGGDVFAEIVQRVGAVYPVDLLEAVERLARSNQIDSSMLARLRLSATRPFRGRSESRADPFRLPAPHPLDYDWRFDEATVNELLHLASAEREAGRLVALGAPSVFRRAVQYGTTWSPRLLDADSVLVEQLRSIGIQGVFRCDLLVDPLPNLAADAVIADPPWYPEHIRAFLWASREILVPGGRVFISIPPLGTRPGIESEREEILHWATTAGLGRTQEVVGALCYRTPPFERNALRAAGIESVPNEWRRGDLWVFERQQASSSARPAYLAEAPEWVEVECHGVRLRLRWDLQPVCRDVDPRLVELVRGDIMPTVSRREPLRQRVRIWSSGNRVFDCADTRLMSVLARAVAENLDANTAAEEYLRRPISRHESERIRVATSQLADLIELERKEYADAYEA